MVRPTLLSALWPSSSGRKTISSNSPQSSSSSYSLGRARVTIFPSLISCNRARLWSDDSLNSAAVTPHEEGHGRGYSHAASSLTSDHSGRMDVKRAMNFTSHTGNRTKSLAVATSKVSVRGACLWTSPTAKAAMHIRR